MEFVFVVPRERLFPEHYPHGVVYFGEGLDAAALRDIWCEHGFFVERAYAERTPALKQIIPYTVVIRDGEVLLLKRSKRGGDARLFDKLSIGVGGHVEPQDLPGADAAGPHQGRAARDPIPGATRREVLEEELSVRGTTALTPIGLLNDDTNSVGAVHVGLVQVLHVEGEVTVREAHTLQGEFVTPQHLRALAAAGANFETWSSLLVAELDRLLHTACPSAGAPS